MASRRDELNAYTFARKRTIAAFLKPRPNGSADDAPRPMRALVPGIVVGALIVVGFGGWGMLSPTAPTGWNKPGEKVLVGSKSTTRYVYLDSNPDDGEKVTPLLYPVLNLASARLLLNPDTYAVLKVDESVLDDPKIKHGPTIGIPYAPDRLPEPTEASKAKVWALCEQPGDGSEQKAQQMVFVLGGKDQAKVQDTNKLTANEALFVQAPDGGWYLVDNQGTAYPIGKTDDQELSEDQMAQLRRALFGQDSAPQKVTSEFMATLNPGSPIVFPPITGVGTTSSAPGLPADHKIIGTVLKADDAEGTQQYVVLQDRLAPVSDFTARLLLQGPTGATAYEGAKAEAIDVNVFDITPGAAYDSAFGWPEGDPAQANKAGGRQTACSVWSGEGNQGNPVLTTWAGTDYPQDVAAGGTSAYVTPGNGLLFRRVSSLKSTVGSVFLVTDTGLMYSVPENGDSSNSAANTESQDAAAAQNESPKMRLGYGEITPVPVLNVWANLLQNGPTLATENAKQPQNQ